MINFLKLFWDSIMIPLAWMPDFLQRFLVALGIALVVAALLSLLSKLAPIISMLFGK